MLAARSVSKSFGSVHALAEVDFSVHPGTVHALLGENGAGKSTLASVLAGALAPDAGTVEVDAQAVSLRSRSSARALGVELVPQHLSLVPGLTLLDNYLLGRGERILDRARGRTALEGALEAVDLHVRPTAPITSLSLPQRQLAEIAIALAGGARILLLDEPTSSLGPGEVGGLFDRLRHLVSAGTAVVLITHRLDEVRLVADEVTVLSHGRRVKGGPAAGLTPEEIARMMVGELRVAPPRAPRLLGEVRLSARGLTVPSVTDAALHELSLDVRSGEIVGIAGVVGSGQTTLLTALAGLTAPRTGSVRVGGTEVTGDPRSALRAGVAWIPGDRAQALVPSLAVAENIDLDSAATRAPRRRTSAVERATRVARDFDVRPPRFDLPLSALSGGNRQKLLVGRELDPAQDRGAPAVVLADGITQGLDLRATAAVRGHLAAAAERGAAVVVSSPDLDELLALSDRIIVLVGGRVADDIPAADADVARIARAMTGLAPAAVAPTAPEDGLAAAGPRIAQDVPRRPEIETAPAAPTPHPQRSPADTGPLPASVERSLS